MIHRSNNDGNVVDGTRGMGFFSSSRTSSIMNDGRPGDDGNISNGGGGEDEDEDDECCFCLACCPEMSWSERLIGCGTCMIAGYILSLGSFFRILGVLFRGNATPLVLNVTIGNIVALMGSL